MSEMGCACLEAVENNYNFACMGFLCEKVEFNKLVKGVELIKMIKSQLISSAPMNLMLLTDKIEIRVINSSKKS